MDANECIPGTRCGLIGKSYPIKKGYIAESPTEHPKLGDTVKVIWDNGKRQVVSCRSLLDELNVSVKENELLAEEERMENGFAKVEREIAGKLILAANYIHEANQLATDNKKTLSQLREACDPLHNALVKAGFRRSK